MPWTTLCENCGAASEFFKDAAGFFVCLSCGQQQQDYREEYRDEFDVLFETTGQYINDISDLRTITKRQKTAFSKEERSRRSNAYSEDDYDDNIENGDFDPEWNKKAPSEADFLRATQSILMYCIKHFVERLGFSSSLNMECRHLWFTFLKILVETDFPAQTFFSDLKSRCHKIGIRRMYTPVVNPIDMVTILEDESIPLNIRLAGHQLGMTRLDYVKRVAPFYNCSGNRRRAPAPEMVKIQTNESLLNKTKKSIDQKITNKQQDDHTILKNQSLTIFPTVTSSKNNTENLFKEFNESETHHTLTPVSLVSPFYSLRPKRTIRERQREAYVSMGMKPPKNNESLPSTRTSIPSYRIPKYLRANPSNKYFKYFTDEKEPTPLGFPQSTLGVMTRERALSLGARSTMSYQTNSSRFSESSTKISISPNPRWQIDCIYEHDFFMFLLDQYEKNSQQDDMLSKSLFGDPLESIPLIIPYDNNDTHSKHVLTNENINLLDSMNSSIESLSKPELRHWIDQQLNKKFTLHEMREYLLKDEELQKAFQEWQSMGVLTHGLIYSTEAKVEKDISEDISHVTATLAHQRFFRHKQLRHELSVTSVIERILRQWMTSTESSLNKETMHQVEELQKEHEASGKNENALVLPSNVDASSCTKICSLSNKTNSLMEPLFSSYTQLVKQSNAKTFKQQNQLCSSIDSTESAALPLKRLDPFYHQDDWSTACITTPVQQLLEWKRLLKNCYSTFKMNRNPKESFHIFDSLTVYPCISLTKNRFLSNDQILFLMKEAYIYSKNTTQLKFLPIFKYILKTSSSFYRHYLRSIALREVYSNVVPPCFLKTRLYDENQSFADPPKIDHILILTLFWMSLINSRYAILSSDICRWVETGVIPLNTALCTIPLWLFESSGICDKYSKFSVLPSILRQDMTCRDRSILQFSETVKASELEKTLLHLKRQGLFLADFCPEALVPRLLHHCGLSTYLQPLIISFLNLLRYPLTMYQDGYSTLQRSPNPLAENIYGYLGPFCSIQSVAAALLIICRLIWPIFVYHPLGMPGVPSSSQPSQNFLTYSYASKRFREEKLPLLYFEVVDAHWVATIYLSSNLIQKTFSIIPLGFIEAGLQALQWLKSQSLEDYNTLIEKYKKTVDDRLTNYKEKQSDKSNILSTELSFLFSDFFYRQKRKEFYEPDNSNTENSKQTVFHPPLYEILKLLPTNQELFHTLIHYANKSGWLDSCSPWTFLNDSWPNATDMEKQIILSQVAHWIYRPTLNQGRWKDVALSLTSLSSKDMELWSCPPTLQKEYNDFVEESFDDVSSSEQSSIQSENNSTNIPNVSPEKILLQSMDHLIETLYRIYLSDVTNYFQEPPMPTRCLHPFDTVFKSPLNDSPYDEIRFPIPYSILLRRVSSFTHMNHLVLHAATSKLESWLFIAEIPERFKMYQKNLHSLENSETAHGSLVNLMNSFTLFKKKPAFCLMHVKGLQSVCEKLDKFYADLVCTKDDVKKLNNICPISYLNFPCQNWNSSCQLKAKTVWKSKNNETNVDEQQKSLENCRKSEESLTCRNDENGHCTSQNIWDTDKVSSCDLYSEEFNLWLHWIQNLNKGECRNILIYGFGSKELILDALTDQCLRPLIPTVAVLRAQNENSNFKLFLSSVVDKILSFHGLRREVKSKSINELKSALFEALEYVPKNNNVRPQRLSAFLASVAIGTISPIKDQNEKKHTKSKASCFALNSPSLCLVIHSLDSPLLRSYQDVLSMIASHPKIFLVGSVDHIRYPLLWSSKCIEKFNFLHFHVPTKHHYRDYLKCNWTEHGPLWLIKSKETFIVSSESIKSALSPMPKKHQELYKEIISEIVTTLSKNNESISSIKVSRDTLFKCSRDNMIYMDLNRFNSALQEFVEHQLIMECVSNVESTAYENHGCTQKSMVLEKQKMYSIPFSKDILLVLYPDVFGIIKDQDDDSSDS